MKVLYRISDKGRPKEKLANANKESCLQNAITQFGLDRIIVFCR
ncbi:MAG: hypothetical protein ACJA2C_000290 [Marinoscillum sp.]|jgi:hypothetical protein